MKHYRLDQFKTDHRKDASLGEFVKIVGVYETYAEARSERDRLECETTFGTYQYSICGVDVVQTFTPGPWTIETHESDPGYSIRVPMGQYIATLQDHFTGHGLANARLIAAAPELFEALKLAIDTYAEVCDCDECHACEQKQMFERIVAKVTGGSNE